MFRLLTFGSLLIFTSLLAAGQDLGSSNKLFPGSKKKEAAATQKKSSGKTSKKATSSNVKAASTAKTKEPADKTAGQKATAANSGLKKAKETADKGSPKTAKGTAKTSPKSQKGKVVKIEPSDKAVKEASAAKTDSKPTSGEGPAKGIAESSIDNTSNKVSSNAPEAVVGSAEANRLFEELILKGNSARDDRDYNAAEAAYLRAIPLKPKDSRAVYGLGNLI